MPSHHWRTGMNQQNCLCGLRADCVFWPECRQLWAFTDMMQAGMGFMHNVANAKAQMQMQMQRQMQTQMQRQMQMQMQRCKGKAQRKGKYKCSPCSYEQERLPRVKTIHIKGVDSATVQDKEKYLFKPIFKPLWQDQVRSKLQHLDLIMLRSIGVCGQLNNSAQIQPVTPYSSVSCRPHAATMLSFLQATLDRKSDLINSTAEAAWSAAALHLSVQLEESDCCTRHSLLQLCFAVFPCLYNVCPLLIIDTAALV